jgi:urea transport system ATP-binding protein
MNTNETLFQVNKANIFYGDSRITRDVSFEVAPRETLAIMGRNGMGKTTLLKALIGILQFRSGSLFLEGEDLTQLPSYERVFKGLAYVPQGRMIFPSLTVEENIQTGLADAKSLKVPKEIYDLFPVLLELKNRRGGNLSGGQQQQLAIARALVTQPKVLLLDEPTEGIQPSIIKEMARTLNRIKEDYKIAIVTTEQSLTFTMAIADRFLIMENGGIKYEEIREQVDEEKIKGYLSV